MPVFLSTSDAGFEARFTAMLSAKREDAADVGDAAILGTRLHGDPRRKAPGIAAGWALVSLAAHLGDRALARRTER